MHILILTVGTQGDVQPYVALGMGLKAAGYNVTIATSTRFAGLITERGLGHKPLNADFLQLMETPEGKAALAGGNPLTLMRKVMPLLRQLLDEGWAAAQGADAIIYHPKALSGRHIAEKLGIPGILAHPVPLFSPTGAFPSPVLFPNHDFGRSLNRLSHHVFLSLVTAPYRKMINSWRKDVLGLPPSGGELERDGQPIPRVYGYSTHVLPTPDDWDRWSVATGYWFLDRPGNWQPPAQLEAFLQGGPPPVYVGFGSMASKDATRVTTLVVEVLQQAGQRGVLATGYGGLAAQNLPDTVYALDAAPHDWLFPQMAAVVHHGGAGTTAAGLRAGTPNVICPFFGDQPFWGGRVAALGVGPQPIPQRRLTPERLAQAIRTAVSDAALRRRAAALGATLRQEDGVSQAVEQVHAFVETMHASPLR
jgi:sterol 3beta-glucosyltransferase